MKSHSQKVEQTVVKLQGLLRKNTSGLSLSTYASLVRTTKTVEKWKSINFLSPEEITKILRLAYSRSKRDHLMILLAYRHGLRASEVCNLKTTDIRHGAVTVKRLKGSKCTTQELDGHRGAPLLNEVRCLADYLQERPRHSGEVLFPSNKGGALSAKSFNFLFKQYALAWGIDPRKCHPHILKHSLGNHLTRAGLPLSYVQQRLGHASISSTQHYQDIADQESDEKTRNALMEIF